MSTENDVARSLGSWLKENRHEDANRVLDVVLDQIPATPQRGAGWLARRFPPMNNYLRFGLVAAVVVLAAVIGIGLYARSGVGGPPPVPTSSSIASPSPSPLASPTPISDPIVGTWAAGETTCAQQVAAVEAAGFTTEQMTSIGMDPTCANGLVIDGSGFTIGSQFTLTLLSTGSLTEFEDGVVGWNARYSLGEGSTFEATDVNAPAICTTWRYAIDGDQLTVELVDPGCAGGKVSPILDQLALTVVFQTSPFTRQP